MFMTSEYVARQVVGLAKHPRRSLVIPWWFRPVLWFEHNFPGAVDLIVEIFFVNRFLRNMQMMSDVIHINGPYTIFEEELSYSCKLLYY